MIRKLIFPAVVILAGYYALLGGEYDAFDLRRMGEEAELARAELRELDSATTALWARVDDLEHDPRTLEALARERFGMIRDGEVLYRFADSGVEREAEEGAP